MKVLDHIYIIVENIIIYEMSPGTFLFKTFMHAAVQLSKLVFVSRPRRVVRMKWFNAK